jgi:hypothetical protein
VLPDHLPQRVPRCRTIFEEFDSKPAGKGETPDLATKRAMEPTTMQKIAIGLSALLLIAAAAKPGAAQYATTATPQKLAECVAYEVAEYPGCLNDGTLSEEQARTARGHPQFVEPQTASQARRPSATPNLPAHASRVVPSPRQ